MARFFEPQCTACADLVFIVLFCRARFCSSQSGGDSSSDSNGDDAVNRTLPGSAIRAKKSAAAKEQAEATMQGERHVSVCNCNVVCRLYDVQRKYTALVDAYLYLPGRLSGMSTTGDVAMKLLFIDYPVLLYSYL